MAGIELQGVTKVFDNGVPAVVNLDLVVRPGESFVLVGPSGCGKTTTLRLIAGLEEPTEGGIRLDGRSMKGVPPRERKVAMVFQRPALLAERTVRDNLDWGRRLRQGFFCKSAAEATVAIEEAARRLHIADILDRRASELSGGQAQRVVLARALLRPSTLWLFDEPLGHLDTALKRELRRELHLLRREFPNTMIYVTHDPEEALALGDRLAVLRAGVLWQQGTSQDLLDRPRDRFMAEFFRSRPLSFLDGTIAGDREGYRLESSAKPALALPTSRKALWEKNLSRAVFLGVRAEDIHIQWSRTSFAEWEMTALLVEPDDRAARVTCVRDGLQVTAVLDRPLHRTVAVGDKVQVGFDLERAFLFDRASGLNLEADA